MSSSPLPKKGSFSNLVNSIPCHRRAISQKGLKNLVLKCSDTPQIQNESAEKIQLLESCLKESRDQLKSLKCKNTHLKKKLKLYQEKSLKNASENQIDSSPSLKTISNVQGECLKLIDSLFEAIESLYSKSKASVDDELELQLIEGFQQFQKKTQINTSVYIRNVLSWRHKFNNELISPADSLKNSVIVKKNTRSVSSIIASTIKMYAVGLKDYNSATPGSLTFKKGEIIEVVNMKNEVCQGRIGGREGSFFKEYVKFV